MLLNNNTMFCSSSLFMIWSLFVILFSCFIFRPASSDLLSSSTDAQLQQLCARFPGMEVCQPDDEALGAMAKRKSAYMRFGRAAAEEEPAMEKRKSAYMRFGKRTPEDENVDQLLAFNEPDALQMEKRKSAYMRFGKRKSAYMRFGRK